MGETFFQAVIGCVVTGVFALLAYLLSRLISENDDFRKSTEQTLRTLGRRVEQSQATLGSIKKQIKESSLDPATKNSLKALSTSLAKVEKDLSKIKPKLDNVNKNTNLIKSQDDKLKGLYKALQAIIERVSDLQSKSKK